MIKNGAGKNFSSYKSLRVTAYIFLIPSIIYYSLIWVYAFIRNVYISFTEYNLVNTPKFILFNNFIDLFADKYFWNALKNTSIFTVLVVPVSLVVSFAVALLINEITMGRVFYRTAIFITTSFSIVASAIVFRIMFNKEFGIINMYLFKTFDIAPIDWLTSSKYALFTTSIVAIWKNIGWYMMIYFAALQNTDSTLSEAAKVDGANEFQIIRLILVPQLRPVILLTSTVAIIGHLQIFALPLVMTRGGPSRSTETIVYYIYKAAFKSFEVGYATAMSMVLFGIVIVFTLIQLKVVGLNHEN